MTEVLGGVATVRICVQLHSKIQRTVHISVSVQSGDASMPKGITLICSSNDISIHFILLQLMVWITLGGHLI